MSESDPSETFASISCCSCEGGRAARALPKGKGWNAKTTVKAEKFVTAVDREVTRDYDQTIRSGSHDNKRRAIAVRGSNNRTVASVLRRPCYSSLSRASADSRLRVRE
jgi:hypothetical protein